MTNEPARQKAAAAKAETEDIETISVRWEGIAIEIPASVDKWEAKTLKAFEENRAIVAVDRLLGARQSNEVNRAFREKHGRAMRVEDYGALMEEIAHAYGFESAGE